MKRSQMEILGLAILFVIIIFGFLLYVKFGLGDERADIKKDFIQPKLASSVLNTMLKTSVDCDGVVYSLTDLLIDCADITKQRIYCDNFDLSSTSSTPESCNIADDITRTLLSNTMDEFNMPYWMEANLKENPQAVPIISILNRPNGRVCNQNTGQREPAYQPYELAIDTLIIGFGICN